MIVWKNGRAAVKQGINYLLKGILRTSNTVTTEAAVSVYSDTFGIKSLIYSSKGIGSNINDTLGKNSGISGTAGFLSEIKSTLGVESDI